MFKLNTAEYVCEVVTQEYEGIDREQVENIMGFHKTMFFIISHLIELK